jgi:DnaJ-class molecular chaperone
MTQVADLYKVLGITEAADADTIKKAFRRLAKEYHPDTHPGDKKAEERFKEISQAYEILSDPEKRRRYDAMRRSPFGAGGNEAAQGTWRQVGEVPFGGSINDIFEMFFGRGASPFQQRPFRGRGEGFGGFGAYDDDEEEDGQDLESEVSASFEDAALGRSITFTLQGRPLRLNLPAGAESGLRLRLAGQGAPGPSGRRGDLYLTLKVRPSPLYRREGLDIISPLRLNLAQALLGTQVEAPTLHGPVRLKVPPGTQAGTRLRLRGKGIVTPSGRGDHYAEISVELPGDLDAEETEAVKRMARRRGWEL